MPGHPAVRELPVSERNRHFQPAAVRTSRGGQPSKPAIFDSIPFRPIRKAIISVHTPGNRIVRRPDKTRARFRIPDSTASARSAAGKNYIHLSISKMPTEYFQAGQLYFIQDYT
jgi:hypothetical protein